MIIMEDSMKKINEIDISNKKVIIRVDYNVPFKEDKITDNSKIEKSLETLKYLLDKNCRIVILSHLGRVKSEEDKKKYSLKIAAKELADLINKPVKFLDQCYGEKVKQIVEESSLGEIIMLENTRIMDFPDKLESKNNETLAKFWASLGEVYVNDAFGSCHRAHASTAGIAKYIPSCVGFLVAKELENLDLLVKNPAHPFTVFMGGAKVDDKIKIISSLLPKCDHLLLGGGIANSFLKAKGADLGSSLATSDEEILNECRKLMTDYKAKIVLPVDFALDDGCIYDVGIKTIDIYKKYINDSSIIFVNGTCGKFEDERFTEGTEALFKTLKESGKTVIVGGGDTVSAVRKFGYEKAFKFLSSGGGATLEYIANGKLDALEWLNK